jgi:hypothetical protein
MGDPATCVGPAVRGSNSLNFYASLHQERFAKWSKKDSGRSHKRPVGDWITEHDSGND